MSDLTALFGVMRQTADSRSVDAMERLIHEGADRDLCRINVLDFATASAMRLLPFYTRHGSACLT
jgi:Family of unknown function (DUF5939)